MDVCLHAHPVIHLPIKKSACLLISHELTPPQETADFLFFLYFNGYLSVRPFTIAFASSALASPSFNIMAIASAILSISSVFKPLEVTAGVPIRIPLVTNGDFGSFGIVFLLQVIFTVSNSFSTALPVRWR